MKSFQGTRDAAQNWEYEYADWLGECGFTRGKSTVCIFWHKERDIRVVVHGDDLTVLASDSQLDLSKSRSAKDLLPKLEGELDLDQNITKVSDC